ncbi:MAG: hypothetical protein KIT16_17775, partial [Rhodospirillaceae bacterium]|nr:hypothetical protein [Rhodospirillaceae bacterium]
MTEPADRAQRSPESPTKSAREEMMTPIRAGLRVAAAAAIVLLSTGARAEPIEIKFASFIGPQAHLNVRVFGPWSERVTRASQGTLKITLVPSGVLGKNGQIVDRVNSGVAG